MNKQFLFNPEYRIEAARDGDWEALIKEIDNDYLDNLNLTSEDLKDDDREEIVKWN